MPVSFVDAPINHGPNIYNAQLVYGDVMPIHAVRIQDEEPNLLPSNFYELPTELQERIKARLRFMGIRLRGDIAEPIQLNRETLDLP